MHINITLLHGYNRSMRKDSVAFDPNRSSSKVLGMTHSNYFHACRVHQSTHTCFQQDGINPSIFLFSNSWGQATCFSEPTYRYSLYPPFPSIPGRPPRIMSYGMSESLPACACRFTMSFTLEGVVSMPYTNNYNKGSFLHVHPSCRDHHNVCVCVCVSDLFLEKMFQGMNIIPSSC